MVPTLFGLTFFVFALIHTGGTNLFLSQYLSPRLTGDARLHAIEQLTIRFHLDDPVYVQYYYWLVELFQGNLGYSTVQGGVPVTTAFVWFMPNTLLLTALASVLTWIVGVPLGVFSAVRRDSLLDQGVRVASFTLYSMPIFLIGFGLLLSFGVYLHWLPISGMLSSSLLQGLPDGWFDHSDGVSSPTHVLEVLEQDYIRLARAKGVPERVINNLHARKNALLPALTSYGYLVAGLLGGAVVVEDIFTFKGVGWWITNALLTQDVGAILGSTFIFGIFLLFTSLILDILYAIIDPR